MKISEMDTNHAAEVLCEITPSIANITGDKALLDALKEKTGGDTLADIYLSGAKKLSAIVPLLFRNHKNDVFGILAAINDCSVDDICAQPVITTMRQIVEMLQDKELKDFFASVSAGEQSE